MSITQTIKRFPCVADFLATPIEPVKQATPYLIIEAVYGSEIVSYTVIMVVSYKYVILGSYSDEASNA